MKILSNYIFTSQYIHICGCSAVILVDMTDFIPYHIGERKYLNLICPVCGNLTRFSRYPTSEDNSAEVY